MPQSLSEIVIYVIFSPKHRYRFLTAGIRPELYAYMATILSQMKSPPILINGTEDHLHVLFRLSRNESISTMVGKMKAHSFKWLKTKGDKLTKFQWQNGYAAFFVSASQVPIVRRYIQNQEQHHRRVSFQDELRRFLEKHGLACDERYVWD